MSSVVLRVFQATCSKPRDQERVKVSERESTYSTLDWMLRVQQIHELDTRVWASCVSQCEPVVVVVVVVVVIVVVYTCFSLARWDYNVAVLTMNRMTRALLKRAGERLGLSSFDSIGLWVCLCVCRCLSRVDSGCTSRW